MLDLKKVTIAAKCSLILGERVSPFAEILKTLAAEVSRLTEKRQRMFSTNDAGDDNDAHVDLESVLNDTLGLATVCCQTMFERTVSAAKKYTRRDWKTDLLGLGQHVDESGFTQAALTCALANYYKHEREWDKANVKRMVEEGRVTQQSRTAGVLMACGLDIKSRTVLDDGIAKLVGRSENLVEFAQIFDNWSQDVRRHLETHLETHTAVEALP